MASQQALFITSKQGPWRVEGRPVPAPGKGDLLVKIHATALNPVDWKIQKSGYFVKDFPAVIGSDSAGEVAQVGEGVTNFTKGDRVIHQGWFLENDKATFQQYAVVPAEIVSKIPDSWSYDDAATLPLGLATAACGLYNPVAEGGLGLPAPWTPEGKDKYKNQSIVILGGSSSVGQFAIQVARLSGFSPIITTSSLKHESFLVSLGATHVIDRSSTDVTKLIQKALPDGKTAVVYDSISLAPTQQVALDVLSPNGKLLLTLPKAEGLDFADHTVSNVFGNVHAQRKLGVSMYSSLLGLLEDGSIKPNRVEVLKGGLSAIPDGLERMAENKVSGVKLVVHPWE